MSTPVNPLNQAKAAAALEIPPDEFLSGLESFQRAAAAQGTASAPLARATVIRLLKLAGDERSAATWEQVVERYYDIPVGALGRSIEQAQLVQGFGARGKALADRERELLEEIARLKREYEPAPEAAPNPWGKQFCGGIGAAFERNWRR